MKISGARVCVEEKGALYRTDLIKCTLDGTDHFFIRDLATQEIDPLCIKAYANADRKLRSAKVAPYDGLDSDLVSGFREAISSKDPKLIRFHVEGLLELLKHENRFGLEA